VAGSGLETFRVLGVVNFGDLSPETLGVATFEVLGIFALADLGVNEFLFIAFGLGVFIKSETPSRC